MDLQFGPQTVDTESLARIVRDARRRLGLRQLDLARRLGVSRMTVSRLERAAPVSSDTALRALAECESGLKAPTLPDSGVGISDALQRYAVSRRDEPFALASGAVSHFYVDVKAALCRPEVLREVAAAIVALAEREALSFTHVGGLTMGADAVAVAVSLASGAQWFSVRKEPKTRGHGRSIEGAALAAGCRVLLVDDVSSTGGSTLKAADSVQETGAFVVAAIPVVDRDGGAAEAFSGRGIRYLPLVHGRDIGVPSLGTE